jgi:ABC-type branched-subunit amino acid transport system permease subunit
MSSRKSDIIDYRLPTTGDLPLVPPRRPDPWRQFLLWNGSIPLLILAVWGISFLVESDFVGGYYRRIVMLIGFNIILAVSLQMINGYSGQFSLGHAGFMAVGAYLAAYPAKAYSARLNDPFSSLVFFVALATCVAIGGAVLLGLFVAIRESRRIGAWLPSVLMVLVLAWILWDFAAAAKLETVPGYYIWTRSVEWVQQFFAWVINVGVPPAKSASANLPAWLRQPLSFLVLVVGAGCCAGVVGLVVGLPTLRLRGDYLAIATLGMGEIIRIGIQNSQPLGGALGLTGIPRYTSFTWLYAFVLVTILVVWRIAYSARGRMIMAVRENEIAAAAVGINNTRQKVTAFIVGAFFGGIAGGLFALFENSISPSYFSVQKSIEIVVIVTLGGLGSISGAILAAIVLTLLPELLRPIADYRMIIYSLLLVVMMLVRPQGLLGGRELWPRRRAFGLKPQRDPAPTEDRREEAVV